MSDLLRLAEWGEKHTHALGMFDHASGHQPTRESMRLAYRWLAEQFSLKPQPWEF